MALTKTTFQTNSVIPYTTIIAGRILGVTSGPSASVSTGKNYTVAYSATGIYTVTFTSAPGRIIAITSQLGVAATPTALKGYTVLAEAFSTTSVKFNVYNASATATALSDLQYLSFIAVFADTSLSVT